MTGNTEEMAQTIADEMGLNNLVETTVIDMFDAYPEDLNQYDGIMIGMYTWGDGDVPDEMLELLDEIEDYDLTSKVVALFGSGDTFYEYFCGALEPFEEALQKAGAIMSQESLKVDMEPSKEDLEACRKFTRIFLEQSITATTVSS